MRRQGWGRIINVASALAFLGLPLSSAYAASKHGVVGLTKVVALETAEENITCNAICPGNVWTPLAEVHIAAQVSQGLAREQVIRNMLLAEQPNKRFAMVEEIGALWPSWRVTLLPRSPVRRSPSMAAGLPIESLCVPLP